MAKFTLTITDAEDGEVEIETLFSPPIKGPVAKAEMTAAQELGMMAMMTMGRMFEVVAGKKAGKGGGRRGR